MYVNRDEAFLKKTGTVVFKVSERIETSFDER
jgi:hypothetical protein